MAILYPPFPPPDTPYSEILVRDSLKGLDNNWKVFHSVAWQSVRNGRQADGEADFVLLHPKHGLIVVEVKGGDEITIENGVWYSRNTKTGTREPIKNPFKQATDSKHALLRYLASISIPTQEVPITHGVCFPGANIDDGIGTYGPPEIVWCKDDLRDPRTMVERLMRHWKQKANMDHASIRKLRQLLAPTVAIKRRLGDDVSEAEQSLIELTDQQILAFDLLRRIRKALVVGGAGTGKTLLAAHRARLYSQEGNRVLLVCYNALLAGWLEKEFAGDEKVTVRTFHSLCFSEMAKASIPIPREPDLAWWETDAPESLATAAQANGTTFDAIIVDEGQDFSADWLTALAMLTPDRDDTPFFVFADSHQDFYARNWGVPPGWPVFPLDTNCRNTNQIAERAAAVLGEPVRTRGIDGPAVVHHEYRPGSGSTVLVEQVVDRLLYEEGLRHDQVTVLSDSKSLVADLRRLGVGEYSFTEFGKFGVVVETVQRFKGLESDVVVLVLTRTDYGQDEELKALPYVGMTRAKSLLFVLSPPGVKKVLGWR